MRNGILLIALILLLAAVFPRCGQPLPPMGGPKDSLPPVLIKATPADSGKNVNTKRLVLEFSEYIQVQDLQQKLVVSPVPNVLPQVEARLKTLTIKMVDTLQPNTTYSLNFGNAVRDINEANAINNFTYVFSTGASIDTGKLSGRILLAETGLADSTIVAILHPELSDTAVFTRKPKYFTRLNKEGFFTFRYLAPGKYNVFALKDADGGLRYDPTEAFGFLDSTITVTANSEPVKLYAFSREPEKPRANANAPEKVSTNNKDDKRLRYNNNTENGSHDFLQDLQLRFERKPNQFDTGKIYLALDTGIRVPATITLDSNIAYIKHNWTPGTKYKLFIEKGMAGDSLGNTVIRNDTLKFSTKKEEDYGSLVVRFMSLDTSVHPVLLFYKAEALVRSVPIRSERISFRLIQPGEYELKILFDRNNNSKWDTGDYPKRIQPELIKPRQQKLNIRANWDNEVDINLKEVQNQG